MSLSFTIGRDTITVFLDGEIHTVKANHANHAPLLAELRRDPDDRDLNAIRPLVSIRRFVEAASFGDVQISGDEVRYKGEPVTGYLAARMLEILQQGIGIEPWAFFMENLMKNPSETAKKELYQWLEKGKLPLTPDGHFIAFKKVRNDYMDCHSGIFDNSVGCIIEMDRKLCDTNRHNHCSTGFHFASVDYLSRFGGQRVVAVKINPRDVTSIPADYNATKGRCCRYEVVAELQNENAAKNGAWAKKAVVDLEDPREFPDLLMKQTEPVEKKKIVSKVNKEAKKTKAAPVSKTTKTKLAKVEAKTDGKKEFRTTTGVIFKAKEILATIKKFPATREVARQLGVGESTLRGWKKSLGL